jgi:hypothetical protein
MNSRHDSVERGLRSIDPLEDADGAGPAPDAEQLLAAIIASGEAARPAAERPLRAPRAFFAPPRRRLLAAVPLAAAALLAVVVAAPSGGGDPSTLPALARVAQAAAAQAPPDLGLPYMYVKTREEVTSGTAANGQYWEVSEPHVREEWIAEDGSGRVRTVTEPPRFLTPKDREAWEAAGRIPFLAHGWSGGESEQDVPAGHFTETLYGGVELAELPTDPEELASWLEDMVRIESKGSSNGFPHSVKVLTLVGDLLRYPVATPELRAALYEAAGLIPGVRYLGATTDQIGRPGVAIGAESANSGRPTLYSLIFDPETSQVLADEETPLKQLGGAPDPDAPTEATVFITSSRTAALGERP